MNLVTYDDYDRVSEQVRQYCAQKYMLLEQALQPYINGDMGDIQPGHATAYITLLKELGRLYRAQAVPRDPEAMIPASKVQQLLDAAAQRQEQAVAEAVAEAEARIMRQLAAQSAGDVQRAKVQVLERLSQVRKG